ncbi:MAG: TerB family tellurite resistance protein [Chloracidobacterium sp.]|nr:TerB family tellurite resistance protein [Chloracidobacterium sp.]
MDNFLLQGIEAYRNQTTRERKFVGYARRIRSLLQTAGRTSDDTFLLMLTPLIEVAWVDGRVGRFEQNAVLKTAEIYGLLKDDVNFVEIMTRLSSRPHASVMETLWNDIADRLYGLPLGMTAAISSLMLEQTRYVADLGQKQIYGLWRGHSSGTDEEINFQQTEKRLSRLDTKESQLNSKTEKNGISDHLKLLPLVKVAWADGRITKRERQMIFDSLFDLGVDPSDENLNQLLHWLELSPKEDFFQESLEKLRAGLETLDDDERAKEKYSLISQCTLIAEVSGGDSNFPAGGRRICDEEITAVKQIARILNGAIKSS